MNILIQSFKSVSKRIGHSIHSTFITWTKPAKPSQLLGNLSDLHRSKAELMAENALLRQQLIGLSRQSQVKPLKFKPLDLTAF